MMALLWACATLAVVAALLPPPVSGALALPLLAAAVWPGARGCRWGFLLMGAVLLLASLRLAALHAGQLPPGPALDVVQSGCIAAVHPAGTRATGLVLDLHGGTTPNRVRVAWHGAPAGLGVGQCWRLPLRLRGVVGPAGPGVADLAARALRQGIGATGHVRAGPVQRLADRPPPLLATWRQTLGVRLAQLAPDRPMQPVLLRLAGVAPPASVGPVPDRLWRVFQRTGTTHLMVISGLHVGLVAAGAWWMARRVVVVLLPLAGPPALPPAVLLAVLVAGTWAAMAGTGPAAIRAVSMVVVALLLLAGSRRVAPWAVLGLAALVVQLIDPLAALDPGFWLSFGAVAGLLWVFVGGTGQRRVWQGLWRAQWAVALALLVLLVPVAGGVAMAAPLANLVAVPVVTLVVVPTVLLATASAAAVPALAAGLLQVADAALGTLLVLLQDIVEMPGHWWPAVLPGPGLAGLATAAAVLCLLPRGMALRSCLLPVVVALLLPATPRVPVGEVLVWVLDVGQGLAVLAMTHRHALLYDTGTPGMAQRVVLPALQQAGVVRLDGLVVSHGDRDHAGGVAGVLEAAAPVQQWHGAGASGSRCAAGQAWQWDGVQFRFLHPGPGQGGPDNAQSCVLLLRGRGGAALLPGDIRHREEALLPVPRRPVDLLVAAHHGSNSSTSQGMLRRWQPRWLAVSAGLDNRWRHPRPEVLARAEAAGVPVACTGSAGTLVWRSWQPDQLHGWRQRLRGWWQPEAGRLCRWPGGDVRPAGELPHPGGG